MRKVLASIIIAAFLFVPSLSSAKSIAISDSDLGAIAAQSGSITITFDNITLNDKQLKTNSTDLADFWNPNWNNGKCDAGKLCHADYYALDNPDYENNYNPSDITTKGYFGYSDVYLTGGLVERSGSMTLEVVSTTESQSLSKVNTTIHNLSIKAHIGVGATIKLSATNSDFASSSQILGRVYAAGISATTNGSVSVYARSGNTYMP
jgi:hypothetical protein